MGSQRVRHDWATFTFTDSILKSKDIILPTKVYTVKAMVFPVVMYECESWIIKKAEHWKIDALKLWCWRRHKSLLDSKEIKPVSTKGNQTRQFIERTGFEAPILRPLDAKSWLIRKRTLYRERLKAKREGGSIGWDGEIASPTQRTWLWANSRRYRGAWYAVVHGTTKS